MALVDVLWTSERTRQTYPQEFNYTINHAETCATGQDIQLLIMVHSAGNHFDSRLTIRSTWGSVAKRKNVRLLFLLGFPPETNLQQHILDEDRTFGDIVQEDFLDTYYNLTLKTVMMIKWVTRHCPRARHVLKIDDDCFLNANNLLDFLGQNLTEVAIYGRIWRSVEPIRSKRSKWYMPYYMYPQLRYPNFTAGPSYLLTQKAVPLLYSTALTTKTVYLEDVYISGICAEKAKVPRIHDSRFYVDSWKLTSPDIVRTAVFTSHQLNNKQLHLIWWLLHDTRGAQIAAYWPIKVTTESPTKEWNG